MLNIKKVYGEFNLELEKLANAIATDYELTPDAQSFHYIDSGFVNANLSFTTGGNKEKYVVRLYGKFSAFTSKELEVQSQLAGFGVSVPKVVPASSGKLVNEFASYKYAIFEFIEGQEPDASTETVARVGELVGQAQQAFAKLQLDVKRRPWLEDKYREKESMCELIESNRGVLREILTEEEFEHTPSMVDWYRDLTWSADEPTEQIIHADIYNPNLLDDGRRISLLDFEAVAYGPVVVDTMTYLAWDLLTKDEHARTDSQILGRVKTYLQAVSDAGGTVEQPQFCFELIQAITLGAAIKNITKAVERGYNSFHRLERYYQNAKFAREHERELVEILAKFSPE
jgi:Ser/Thr protein kinase RdoA (MazF antagonist)